jgi:hypothetical protein
VTLDAADVGAATAEQGETADTAAADLAAHKADYTTQIPFATTSGDANTYTVSTTPALPSLATGVAITVKINAANTGASTLNWDSKGATAIKNPDGTALASGDLATNGVYTLRYDGTNFILQGKGGVVLTGDAVETNVLAGKTFYKDDAKTKLTGTLLKINAGSNLLAYADTEKNARVNNTYVKVKSVTINATGSYRVSFDLKNDDGSVVVYGRVYKNGSGFGTERSKNNNTYATFTEDLDFTSADTCELRIKTSNLGAADVRGRNFRLYAVEGAVVTQN